MAIAFSIGVNGLSYQSFSQGEPGRAGTIGIGDRIHSSLQQIIMIRFQIQHVSVQRYDTVCIRILAEFNKSLFEPYGFLVSRQERNIDIVYSKIFIGRQTLIARDERNNEKTSKGPGGRNL